MNKTELDAIEANLTRRNALRNLGLKIGTIPKRYAKRDGTLDLDKVHLVLHDYQKKKC